MTTVEAPTVAEPAAPPKPKRVRTPRPPKAQALTTPPTGEPTPVKPKRTRVAKPKTEGGTGTLVPTGSAGNTLDLLAKLPAPIVGDLSKDQRHRRYAQMKRIITLSLGSFVIVGAALKEIRDQEYWKLDRYPSWEEFLQVEWDLGSRNRAGQLIDASSAYLGMAAYIEDKKLDLPLPRVEYHVDQLQRLSTVEARVQAWQHAMATAERKAGDRLRLTGEHIKGIVEESLTGHKSLPQRGRGTNTPTPPSQPPEREQIPETVERPEDSVPPDSVTPPAGQEDPLDGNVPELERIELVRVGQEAQQMTPRLAMEYLIRALKGGYLSHRDDHITTLADVLGSGLTDWLDSADDEVEIDYEVKGPLPEITVSFPDPDPTVDSEDKEPGE